MLSFSIFSMAAVSLMGCSHSGSSTKKSEAGKGWVNMLESLKDWHTYNKPGTMGGGWSLQDGVLYLNASHKNEKQQRDGGNIVFRDDFVDFHLKMEWKISAGGNSGIFFNVKEDPAYRDPYETGPEMQVLDNAAHPDSKIIKHRAGDLYDLISCSRETVKPAGEWNLVEIISNKGNLEFFLNGEKVVSTRQWDDNWYKMIAGSKFKNMPGFGTFKGGKISLQDHGDDVWFRNMMIRPL